jgi:putative Mg2+ transporter-C (MgtC) family protein
MTWKDFLIRLIIALILGAAIGIERQWLKTRAVLKTNVLVTLGAAMFVMMAGMIPGDSSPTRVAAQVVSGIGFLGGGVIFKEGASIRGLNTAATLWCAAAIGTLTGSGFLIQAYCAALAVVGANLMFRHLGQIFQPMDDYSSPNISSTVTYRFRLVCERNCESQVRSTLLEIVRERQLVINTIHIQNLVRDRLQDSVEIEIKVDFLDLTNDLDLLEEIVKDLRDNAEIKELIWEYFPKPLV